ncbi:efflux RND transporter permease subunit [Novosphingobium sp. FKTRR1]|uniref:efflux RND transporter permease subunit n=1 Tax=Novosphingobium sp. FKTRR1 TaxID=2879118 RepID=UPI001CF063D4|nr:efflux RND transporter permease subunit [Novosphingobium sp. FKTRR1]
MQATSLLTGIVRQSLRHPVMVVCAALLLLGFGAIALRGAAFDVFPDFVPPQAQVQVEAPGFTPLQVEQRVTRPLEAAINGANGVAAVRSQSLQGLSAIDVIFREGSDPYRARQQVAEALADAASVLPAGVDAPRITPLTSSTMDLLKVGLVSDRLTPMQLRDLALWTIRPRLLAAAGVARVNVFGGEQRRIEVRVRPMALLARGLTPGDVAAAVSRAVAVSGGGFADTPDQRILIDPGAGLHGAQAIAGLVVAAGAGGGAVKVADVAEVVDAAAPRFGDALVMGRPGVLLTISSQYGANTLDSTQAVEAALAELTPVLARQGVQVYPALHRPANFIATALAGLGTDLLIGAALIALVLLVFLRRLRVVLIAFVSIPLSLVAALLVLDLAGQTINTMTLGGLAVALGVVIDDAIVDIENIVRRLRGVTEPAQRRAVIEAASVEVRAPVVYATFVLVLSMAPVIALTGLQGAFFAPLGVAFVLATLASLLVALTLTPALALLLLGGVEPPAEPRFLEHVKNGHARWVERLSAMPGLVAGTVGAIGFAAALGAMAFGSELLPALREQHYVIGINGPAGASFDWMRAAGQRLSGRLLAIPQVLSVEEQMGRAEAGEDTWPPSQGEFHVRLRRVNAAGEDAALDAIRHVLDTTPAIRSEVTTFLGDRISESLSGETAAVSVGIHGTDLDQLDRVAGQVAMVIGRVSGAADVQVATTPATPMLGVTPDPARMALHGVSAADAGEAVRATFAGLPAGQVGLADRAIDVVVTVPPTLRRDPEALGDVLVRASAAGATGSAVRLADVATIVPGSARSVIAHEGGQRRQVVTANVTGRSVSNFVADAQSAIARDVALPSGVYLSWAGAAEGQAAATRQLEGHVALTAIAMVGLLVLAFGGLRPALLILAGMPLAMAGGVAAVALTGGVVSLGALVGFITLFGISARNAILLVAHADHLVAEEGLPWSFDTLLRAVRERVTPIVLTALVTAFALLPLALANGEAGREIQGPMAIVILGGLASSLVLTLLLLPALVWRWRHRP